MCARKLLGEVTTQDVSSWLRSKREIKKKTWNNYRNDLSTFFEWCVFFALALFAGVRPDMANGEMSKLAAAVGRDGPEKYFCNGVVHITAEMAKDKRARQTRLPAWFR